MASTNNFEEKETSPANRPTRNYFKQIWELLVRYSGIDQIANENFSTNEKQIIKSNPQSSPLLVLLRLIPWGLALVFIFSFVWDFEGFSVLLFGTIYLLEGLLKVVSVSGLIGFSTNWLAITMLFRPLSRRPILGQGLIPSQKKKVAYRLAHTVSKDLINPEVIKQKIRESNAIARYQDHATEYLTNIIEDPNFRHELKLLTMEYVQSLIGDPKIRTSIAKKIITELESTFEDRLLEKAAVKTYTFLRRKQIQDIIEESLERLPAKAEYELDKLDTLLDEVPHHLNVQKGSIENIVTTLLYRLINQLDVHTLVEENLRRYDEKKLEKMIKGATHEQLTYIQYLGAVLGTIGGFVIWQPLLSLTVLGFLIAAILTVDKMLLNFFKWKNTS